MKVIAAVLLALLMVLQYRLWLGDGGMREIAPSWRRDRAQADRLNDSCASVIGRSQRKCRI